jgi:hypothetical protein
LRQALLNAVIDPHVHERYELQIKIAKEQKEQQIRERINGLNDRIDVIKQSSEIYAQVDDIDKGRPRSEHA